MIIHLFVYFAISKRPLFKFSFIDVQKYNKQNIVSMIVKGDNSHWKTIADIFG